MTGHGPAAGEDADPTSRPATAARAGTATTARPAAATANRARIVAVPSSARSPGTTAPPASAGRPSPISDANAKAAQRSEEHTSELQSLMRISYAVFCLKKKNKQQKQTK